MRERLIIAAVIVGVASVAALGFLVLGPGRLDPSPPSLRANPRPEIPGEILYVEDQDCIVAVTASGAERRQLRCTGGVGALTWLEDGRVAYLNHEGGQPVWTVFDPATGSNAQVAGEVPRFSGPRASVRGETAEIDQQGNLYVQSASSRDRIYTFDELPEYRRPTVRLWSPDGEWLLLQFDDELWVVRRDGSVAGTLVSEKAFWSSVSWRIPGAGVTTDPPRPDPLATVVATIPPAATPAPSATATATP